MIDVVQVDVNSAKLKMAEDGLNRLSEVIGGMMKRVSTGELPAQVEDEAARTAESYLRIGAAACHILGGCIELLERSEAENG